MEITIIFACVLLTVVAIWLVGIQRSKQKKKMVYVCNRCGEHDCECTPKSDI